MSTAADVPGMDALETLTIDHRAVERLFAELRSKPVGQGREWVVGELVSQLLTHAFIEERVLYPAIRRVVPGGDELADAAVEEHRALTETLARLEALDPNDHEAEILLAHLQRDLRDHVDEEEGVLFRASFRCGREPPSRDGRRAGGSSNDRPQGVLCGRSQPWVMPRRIHPHARVSPNCHRIAMWLPAIRRTGVPGSGGVGTTGSTHDGIFAPRGNGSPRRGRASVIRDKRLLRAKAVQRAKQRLVDAHREEYALCSTMNGTGWGWSPSV